MKFREIFRFELAYQVRRVSTWAYAAVLVGFAALLVRGAYLPDARSGAYFLNAPFVIASITVFGGAVWLLMAAAVAGDAAVRDVQTGMHPLTYTAPVSKADYLGGRFLAAFVLNASILLALPGTVLLALHLPGVEPAILGPFRPAAYLSAYVFIALPNAFAATAIQFAWATRSRRAMASYLASVVLLVTGQFIATSVAELSGRWALAKLVDPVGIVGIARFFDVWTPIERNTRLISLDGSLLANRLLWLAVALGLLAFTYARFRFAHQTDSPSWGRLTRLRRRRSGRRARLRDAGPALPTNTGIERRAPIFRTHARQAFGVTTGARQTLAIARTSFWQIAKSRGGLTLVAAFAMPVVIFAPELTTVMGVRVFPTSAQILDLLTAPLTNLRTPWILIPLLIVFYAGELVWREREAGLGEMAGAAPASEWVLFLGRFLGLGLALVMWMALLGAAGMLAQAAAGSRHIELGLYLRILLGLQLTDYLLFALLVLVVHVIVNQKHVGHLVALVVYGGMAVAPRLGIEHHLLVYGTGPGWSYTDMPGFGASVGPWLWFKAYWAAWALLLAVAAKLLWARGMEGGFMVRLRLARRRFTRPTAAAAAAAAGLILTLGGFIFSNTNVLNAYSSTADRVEWRAQYERRYGRDEDVPQPRLTAVNLRVEIYPGRRAVDVSGTYHLVNRSAAAIGAIHVTTVPGVATGAISFDRAATRVLDDEELGYRTYSLGEPIEPGDSLQLNFAVHVAPHGFSNGGVDASVVANGTYFTSQEWLPAIGYQPGRELTEPADRRARGLPPRPAVPSLGDAGARQRTNDTERIGFEAVVSTDADQMAVAPGTLRRTWTEGARRYFDYAAEAPIQNRYAFFSANYAVREARWHGVAIQIFHDPRHAANLERMVRGVQASLDYDTAHFGPYPYRDIRLVEHPSQGFGLHAEAVDIAYDEGFSLLNPPEPSRGFDLVFSVVAHEVAHEWWGAQLPRVSVEGSPLLSESLAWYSAMRVVEQTYGEEQLQRLLHFMRTENPVPPTRAAPPLLRATDRYLAYRKGPFALYALSEYLGEERFSGALRRLIEEHGSGARPFATSLDLYQELQAVTPAALQSLLHDLFETNTWWELETKGATAHPTGTGTWQVTLDVRARKVVVGTDGAETDVPMDEPVQVGVFAPGDNGDELSAPLGVEMHRIRSGEQTITVTVPRKPARAGIDPYHLLDWDAEDNTRTVTVAGGTPVSPHGAHTP